MNEIMNIEPEIWGPHMWFTIHHVALGYPDIPSDDDKIKYKIFYENLKFTIPCEKCRLHYEQTINSSIDGDDKHLRLRDEIFRDKITLFRWTVDIHNKVNIMLNKPIVRYHDAIRIVSKEIPDTNNYILYRIIIIFIIFILYIKLKKR